MVILMTFGPRRAVVEFYLLCLVRIWYGYLRLPLILGSSRADETMSSYISPVKGFKVST